MDKLKGMIQVNLPDDDDTITISTCTRVKAQFSNFLDLCESSYCYYVYVWAIVIVCTINSLLSSTLSLIYLSSTLSFIYLSSTTVNLFIIYFQML